MKKFLILLLCLHVFAPIYVQASVQLSSEQQVQKIEESQGYWNGLSPRTKKIIILGGCVLTGAVIIIHRQNQYIAERNQQLEGLSQGMNTIVNLYQNKAEELDLYQKKAKELDSPAKVWDLIMPGDMKDSFMSVAGNQDAKEELSNIVNFLKYPDLYGKFGAQPSKGILLTGLPGTGKTALARATAGEANVPFFCADASNLQTGKIVGDTAENIRSLFKQAREVSPSIIFIDEIDAIGGKRSGDNSSGAGKDHTITINQLLRELDGFNTNSKQPVVVLAATNYHNSLDPALVRAGRFDHTISVLPPDQGARSEIFKIHAKKIAVNPMSIEDIAQKIAAQTEKYIVNVRERCFMKSTKKLLLSLGFLCASQGAFGYTLEIANNASHVGIIFGELVEPASWEMPVFYGAVGIPGVTVGGFISARDCVIATLIVGGSYLAYKKGYFSKIKNYVTGQTAEVAKDQAVDAK